MPKFNWEARTRTGGTQKGVIEAATVDVVEAQLKKYGFSNINIKAEAKAFSFKLPSFGGGKSAGELKDAAMQVIESRNGHHARVEAEGVIVAEFEEVDA